MIITKATAMVETVESENPNGEFDVILSTNALDRDGDNLNPDEWKTPLPEHITFDSDHGMSVATTVGSGKPFINEQGQLQVRGMFASTPHAQNVRTLVNEGHIKTTSVAFMERKGKKDSKPERELLNGAFVAVPANAEAVVLSSKSIMSVLKDADTTTPAPEDMVQAAHDALVHLGAACACEPGTGATDGANKGIKARHPGVNELISAGVEISKDASTQTSGPMAGSPQSSPDSDPADAATKAAANAPAEVPANAAELSADDVALRARGLAFLLKANASKEIE